MARATAGAGALGARPGRRAGRGGGGGGGRARPANERGAPPAPAGAGRRGGRGRGWGLRADGGLGSQQVSDTSAHQVAWHVGLALSRGWGPNGELALVGSITNSAGAASTTGTRTEAFRYRALGLRFRQGL